MGKIINLHVTVFGRVQGVGYRFYAQKTAKKLALKGFVKNHPDGTVFIEIEGEDALVSSFIAQCKTGPGWAHVEKLEINEFPVRGFSEFKVKY